MHVLLQVVPGSHTRGDMPRPGQLEAGEELITAKAGDVVVFNAHLLHGGTANTSGGLRRCCHLHVIRRSEPQQVDQQRYCTAETLRRVPAAALAVLDVAGGRESTAAGSGSTSSSRL